MKQEEILEQFKRLQEQHNNKWLPGHECPYCTPRCPTCGRPYQDQKPDLTWTLGNIG